MANDPRALLKPATSAARTPGQLRRLADQLDALVNELNARADALDRQQARPPAQRVTPRSPRAGPGRAPGHTITIATEEDVKEHGVYQRVRVVIGRGLWYALYRPITDPAIADARRLAVRWNTVTGAVWFEPCGMGDGYAVTVGRGSPRFYADGVRDQLPPTGRYPGVVRDGAIWFADAPHETPPKTAC